MFLAWRQRRPGSIRFIQFNFSSQFRTQHFEFANKSAPKNDIGGLQIVLKEERPYGFSYSLQGTPLPQE
jgi:hypothetical protein